MELAVGGCPAGSAGARSISWNVAKACPSSAARLHVTAAASDVHCHPSPLALTNAQPVRRGMVRVMSLTGTRLKFCTYVS